MRILSDIYFAKYILNYIIQTKISQTQNQNQIIDIGSAFNLVLLLFAQNII